MLVDHNDDGDDGNGSSGGSSSGGEMVIDESGDDENVDDNDNDDNENMPVDDDFVGGDEEDEDGENQADFDAAWLEKMYYDRDCSNNISKSLRVVPLEDVQVMTKHCIGNVQQRTDYYKKQVVPGRDGYAYFFTSMAEGPMLSSMAMQQILVLLHVIHSFIPEDCILETDTLKPFFDKAGGLEKLVEWIEMSEEEWMYMQNRKKQIARMPLSDIPRQVKMFHDSYILATPGKFSIIFGAQPASHNL
jgi:hypothetical protein